MNIKEKWAAWKWLKANGLGGKRNACAVPKDRDIQKMLDSLDATQLLAFTHGRNLGPAPVQRPKTRRSLPNKTSGLKDDPGWTKDAQAAFFASRAWRELRYKVLASLGGKCCLCGRTAHHGVVLHVDHIRPASKYPDLRLDFDNLQVLCEDCNIGKSNKDASDWRSKPVLVKKKA
jgi:hypothetical protein